jgi:hypothetical protein
MAPHRSCDDAREALWPDPTQTGGPADARAHYEVCRPCQQFFVRDRRLGERLAGLPHPAAPDVLRARVGARLHRDRRAILRWSGVGMAAVAAALALVVLGRGDPMDAMAAPFASAARATDSASLAMPTDSPDALGAWFASTGAGQVTVPAIAGAELVGGKVEMIHGHRAAVVLYRMHGDPLAYFAMPDSAVSPGEMDRGIAMSEDGEMQVALWREPGGVRAVAAAMPESDIMAVATKCRNQAMSGIP